MTITEFSDQFDVLYNNITSNQAPGLNEYEKSVFLTKAEKEVVKNYFTANSKGNNLGQGFDDSAKRQADFSVLMKTSDCATAIASGASSTSTIRRYTCTATGGSTNIIRYGTEITFYTRMARMGTEGYDYSAYTGTVPANTYTITYTAGNAPYTGSVTVTQGSGQQASSITLYLEGWPFESGGSIVIADETITSTTGQIDPRSAVYQFPNDAFIIVNEVIVTTHGRYLQVIPLRYDEYTRLMSKPFKYPVKNQAWRLMNSGIVADGKAVKKVELITNSWDTIQTYSIRYVRVPKPIIVANLGDLSIDGQSAASTECEIDPILHEDILQRAVELAKIAWTATGQDNAQLVMTAGQRTE